MTTLATPLNLTAWINDHRHLLKPPVSNKCVWEDRDFIVMVVAGPNQRKDYHINPTEELFFQVEGDILLRIIDAHAQMRELPIRQGEMFLLPPNVPHSPQRAAGTVGLVIERRRPRGDDDQLRFYCEKCNQIVYEESFELKDIGGQLKRMMDEFWSDATLRTCVHCGTVVTPPSGTIAPPSKTLAVPQVKVGTVNAQPAANQIPGRKVPAKSAARPATSRPASGGASRKKVVIRR